MRKVVIRYVDGEIRAGWVIEETKNYIHVHLDYPSSINTQWVERAACEEIIPSL